MSFAVTPGRQVALEARGASSSAAAGRASASRARARPRRCRCRTRARRRRRASRCGCRRRRSSFPGWVSPSSGPITWTIPSLPDPVPWSAMPNSSQFARSASSCAFAIGSVIGPGQRRDVVVHRRDREVGPAHAATGEPQALERLRRGDLVDEVQVDVEQRRLTRLVADDVLVPDLLEQACCPASSVRPASTSSRNASASASIVIGIVGVGDRARASSTRRR